MHRRDAFRAHERTVAEVKDSSVEIVTNAQVTALRGDGAPRGGRDQRRRRRSRGRGPAQALVAALGFIADLGAIQQWGLVTSKRHVVVDSAMRTNLPRVFAAGDITDYPGKVRLIAVGFGEAATAVNNAAVAIDPSRPRLPRPLQRGLSPTCRTAAYRPVGIMGASSSATRKAEHVRIAMLSYRSKPHCGGQGVYIRHLSRELVRLGHEVEVFSGQPYPDLDEGVRLTKVPSLDLYREPDPFRVPKLREFRDRIDVEEFLTMCTAGFPEPKTFSSRIARLMKERAGDFDIAHDNQVLGTGDHGAGVLRPAGRRDHPPPDHDGPQDRPADRAHPAQAADAAPVVRLPADADQGRQAAAQGARAVGVLAPRRRPRLRRRPGPDRRRSCSASTTSSRRRPRRACRAASSPWRAPTPR